MRDLRPDLANLWRTAARLQPVQGARTILFIAARSGEGTTSMAASFALMAAQHAARTAWLVDLDFGKNPAFRGFDRGFSSGVGRSGRAYDASLGTAPVYALSPEAADGVGGTKLLTAHQVAGTRLLVTRFRNERLAPGQVAHLRQQPAWWAALRRAADWIVIDAPAPDRSADGLAAVGEADAVVLVVSAAGAGAEELAALRADIGRRGGNVIGVVLNRARADARMAGRIGRQAGRRWHSGT